MEHWDNVPGCSTKKASPLKVTLESTAPLSQKLTLPICLRKSPRKPSVSNLLDSVSVIIGSHSFFPYSFPLISTPNNTISQDMELKTFEETPIFTFLNQY